MKQGWEIKKLGEVCEIQGGSTPKRTESSFWDNGTYPWFTIEDIREQGHIISDTKQKITKIAWDKMRIFPKDTILLCCTASLGEYAITQIPLSSNQQFNGLTIKDKNYLSPMYLMHYCSTLKNTLLSLSGKATIDFVSAEKVKQIPIPVPSREEQDRIVEELDCLSGVIEKKREQLKELDALAQSIFYQMFGDPIINEKGWEVKKLGEVASEIFAGGDKPKDFSDIQTNEYLYPIYANGEGDRGLLGYSKTYRVESKAVALGARGASIGNCRICEGKFTPVVRLITIIPNNKIDIIYLFYSIRTMSFNISGAGQAQLTTPNVINKIITIPPLALQQEFADKIEAIEKQKELIKQSIAETEELFNSRMEYYFN